MGPWWCSMCSPNTALTAWEWRSGDYAVARDSQLLHAEAVCAVCGEHIELHEGPIVDQHLDAVPGGCFAGCATPIRGLGLCVQRLVAALAVQVDLLFRDRGLSSMRRFDAFEGGGGPADGRERFWSPGSHTAYRRRVPEYGPLRLDIDRSVTLRQLRTFKTVADLNSFSLAAQQLRLSQPSVWYQVKELEEAIGLPLLDRLGRRVNLTEAGSVLYSYARRTLDVLDEASLALEEMRGIKRGNLRVGASTTVGIYLLP